MHINSELQQHAHQKTAKIIKNVILFSSTLTPRWCDNDYDFCCFDEQVAAILYVWTLDVAINML